MIITDKFVLLDFPKTGTTFTTTVLRNIHGKRRRSIRMLPERLQEKILAKRGLERPDYSEVRIPRPEATPQKKQKTSRHGGYRDIPEWARHLPIVSVMRNPFSRYTSAILYRMRSRKRIRHMADPDELQTLYPGYPELDFPEFYDMMHRFEPDFGSSMVRPRIDLGAHSIAFIQTYFRDPVAVFEKIDHDYIESGAYREDMPEIHFLHQENLRDEFRLYLLDMGYPATECAEIDVLGKVNVARRKRTEQDIESFYTPELTELVLQRDALLFHIFPQYRPGPT